MALEPGTHLGRYELQALLGAGAMGEVYRARDARLGRLVAVKILPPHVATNPSLRERFDREARAIAALNHPNICAVYDVGEASVGKDAVVHFLVMELLEGDTLDVYLRSHRLSPARATELGVQIAAGLEAAHAKGIVHRDVKPGNIFITREESIKITDFGLATFAGARAASMSVADTRAGEMTMPGSAVGTAAYMSPEQARGELVDERTDVFALGAVLFEMATGRPAFHGATLATVFDSVLNVTPPQASTVAPEVSAPLSQVIATALEKDRDRRHQRVADLRADLQRVAAGATVSSSLGATSSLAAPVKEPAARSALKLRQPYAWLGAAAAAALLVAAGVWVAHRPVSNATAQQAPIRSVAVLPLADLSGSPGDDYFTDGMTDELIATLSRIRDWRVISRTSVMPYKNAKKPLKTIAEELGVDALVEGSIQRSPTRVRVTARLIRARADEQNLWTGTFDHDVKDVLDIESDIARAIVDQIKVTLTPQERQRLEAKRPVDPEVFQLLLRGRAAADLGTEDALFKAIGYDQQALQKNEAYAPAHAAMALAYESMNPSYRAPKEVMPKAREHAVRAIELDDSLSEAHAALADVMFVYDWDWTNAEQEIRRAIDLDPNSFSAHELYGNYLTALNRVGPAIDELTLAHQLNPADLPTWSALIGSMCTLRQYDRAIAEARRAIDIHPDFAFAHAWLGMSLVMKGQIAQGLPSLERARALDNNVTTTHFLAMAQAAAGNRREAERLVSGLEDAAAKRYTCAFEVASVHLQLGNTEKAMEWLRRGVDEQCDCLVWLKTEQWIDPLRIDPRYADLVRRVGFPEH